jgi:hypothetical protein
LKTKVFYSTLKNALAYYNAGVGLAPGNNPTTWIYNASVVKIYNASVVKIYNATMQ